MLPISNATPSSTSVPAGFVRRNSIPQPAAKQKFFTHKPVEVNAFRQGYPRLAAFVNCDSGFTAFRRFGRIHARVLLSKQDELIELEEQLQSLDEGETNDYNLRTRRLDLTQTRSQLLLTIENKLVEYHEVLKLYYESIERPIPKRSNVKALSRWLNKTKPLVLEESKFLDDWDDLVSPARSNDFNSLNSMIESIMSCLDRFGLRIGKCLMKKRWSASDHRVLLFDNRRTSLVTRAVIIFTATVMLTLPVVGLYLAKQLSVRIWIVVMCTAGFSTFVGTLTYARNVEIFSATAAYCAVLVVFVGNLPVSGCGPAG